MMMDAQNSCDSEILANNHDFVDIINELDNRHIFDVLCLIVGYLDDKSLSNGELVSKRWNAAISKGKQNKLWKELLQRKISTNSLWENLHYKLIVQSQKSPLDYRKVFKQIQFGIDEALEANWKNRDYIREHVDCNFGSEKSVFKIGDKFIILYEPNTEFQIWNRLTLKLEEVYSIPLNLRPRGFIHSVEVVYELYEDLLIHTWESNQIIIRNLTTKKLTTHSPFPEMDGRICSIRAENGFLCAAVKFPGQNVSCFDLFVWKIIPCTDVDWEDVKKIPSLSVDTSKIFMDNRFFVVRTDNGKRNGKFEIRTMLEPQIVQRVITFNCLEIDFSYYEGFLVSLDSSYCVQVVNVESGDKRVLRSFKKALRFTKFNIRIYSGYIFVINRKEADVLNVVFSKFDVWKFQDAINPDVALPLKPFFVFEGMLHKLNAIKVDAFGITTVGRKSSEENRESCRITIREINFLPICNYCKDIRKTLMRCSLCNSAKYCDDVCKRADQEHHKIPCHEINSAGLQANDKFCSLS